MPLLFQNLRVYQQALSFAERVAAVTASFSRPDWYLADQFKRASLSIALNVAEGRGRGTDADERRFLVMARGSVHECAAPLDMCERRKLVLGPLRGELDAHLTTISKMLAGMINRPTGTTSVKEDGEQHGP